MFFKKQLWILFTTVFLITLTACNSNEAEKDHNNESKLTISAAASLTDALEEIKSALHKKNSSISVQYNFGGSGNLSQQIQQGAPADIFLSASRKDMDTLSEKGLIVEDSRFDFVQNKLVIIANKNNSINVKNLEDMTALNVNDIAMGDANAVPAGRYGKQSFEKAGVWDKLEGKIVNFSDVRQVLTQVETGNAELGIVYQSDALQSDKVKIILAVDPSLHDSIIYPAAIIKDSQNKKAAQQYLDFLKSEDGKEILESFGFITN